MAGDMKGSHTAATHIRLQWQFMLSAWGFHRSLSHTAAKVFSRCCQKQLIIESSDYSYMGSELSTSENWSLLFWSEQLRFSDWFLTFVLEDNPISGWQYFFSLRSESQINTVQFTVQPLSHSMCSAFTLTLVTVPRGPTCWNIGEKTVWSAIVRGCVRLSGIFR